MLNGKTILAVVPARGGSKGIPLKNLQPVHGVSLVARVGQVISELPEIDRAVVSTDHEDIARVAEAAGLAAPFRRPAELSGDRIGDIDVLTHALNATEELDGRRYDIVVMLQPTSPLRRPEQVRDCLRMLVDGGWDAVWTVSETDSKGHPLKQLTLGENAGLDYYDPAAAGIIARQQLTPVYHRNGIAYALTRECLLEQLTLKGPRTGALVIDGPHVSIDTPFDLALVEWLATQPDAV
jgi:CMP-N,N'-diacetyllegionaminic acid synthase